MAWRQYEDYDMHMNGCFCSRSRLAAGQRERHRARAPTTVRKAASTVVIPPGRPWTCDPSIAAVRLTAD